MTICSFFHSCRSLVFENTCITCQNQRQQNVKVRVSQSLSQVGKASMASDRSETAVGLIELVESKLDRAFVSLCQDISIDDRPFCPRTLMNSRFRHLGELPKAEEASRRGRAAEEIVWGGEQQQ